MGKERKIKEEENRRDRLVEGKKVGKKGGMEGGEFGR